MGLFDLFSNDSAEKARDMANTGARAGYTQLSDLYGQGRTAIDTGYGKAAGVAQDTLNMFSPGAATYGDATGAAGAAGLARATDLFHNSGDYGVYGVANKEAQQALQRTHAAAGNPLSGNADIDAMTKASDLAQKSWGSWVSGLSPYLGATQTAANTLGNVYTGQAGALNASDMAQGNAANATETAIGNNNAGAEMNNYKVGANILNAGLGVGSLLAGGAGGGGLTSGLTSLFSGFGKTASPSYAAGGYSPATNAPVYANPQGGSWYG